VSLRQLIVAVAVLLAPLPVGAEGGFAHVRGWGAVRLPMPTERAEKALRTHGRTTWRLHVDSGRRMGCVSVSPQESRFIRVSDGGGRIVLLTTHEDQVIAVSIEHSPGKATAIDRRLRALRGRYGPPDEDRIDDAGRTLTWSNARVALSVWVRGPDADGSITIVEYWTPRPGP
jgi:hypothetical protein